VAAPRWFGTKAMAVTVERSRPRILSGGAWSFLYRREVRQVVYQVLLVLGLAALFWMIITNTASNLQRRNVELGFGFLDRTAGFDISQALIAYENTSSYGRALLVGLVNTIFVAGIGIVLATVLGFIAGIARLSTNWLIAKIAAMYVEVARNVPLLLQLFVWYFGVLQNLPGPRQSYSFLGESIFINVRGLYLPEPIPRAGFDLVLAVLLLGLVASVAVYVWARRRQMLTGQRFPVLSTSLVLIVVLPFAVFLILGAPLRWDYPALQGFNFHGGIVVLPELIALLAGLVVYTGSYIAEIVRAGILGVSTGQKEAARALGLTKSQMLRLVVIPQALRIIIPPLTSQHLNLTKNSSLAVAIAYPDLVSVGGTVLNQTGQAIEVLLMIMGVYLVLSLLTSAFMNWFNRRMALVEK
jgi:general L-amino acid transport system permease protein